MTTCPFCLHENHDIIAENETCLAFRDGFPLSEGHTLIVPRRHVASYFDLSELEQRDLLSLVPKVCTELNGMSSPNGYNIGINEGSAAGQTIMHVHLHVIPRHDGDIEDPRGGIRWVLPHKARYWSGE